MSGFWRLSHEDLTRVLARTDLSWETARVYLALADLTIGYGKEKDTVSLGQIADATGMDRPHVVRALKCLSQLGLYGQEKVSSQEVIRWVAWPPLPVANDGNRQGVAKGVAGAGSRTVAKGVASLGTHQDTKKKDTKTNGHDLGHFDRFWTAYPRKEKRKDALAIWGKINPDEAMVEVIISAAQKHADLWQAERRERKHIPLPTTWLNGERWTDELPPPAGSRGNAIDAITKKPIEPYGSTEAEAESAFAAAEEYER